MIIFCVSIAQCQNKECVYIVLCYFVKCVDCYIHHYNQDTDLFHHHKCLLVPSFDQFAWWIIEALLFLKFLYPFLYVIELSLIFSLNILRPTSDNIMFFALTVNIIYKTQEEKESLLNYSLPFPLFFLFDVLRILLLPYPFYFKDFLLPFKVGLLSTNSLSVPSFESFLIYPLFL